MLKSTFAKVVGLSAFMLYAVTQDATAQDFEVIRDSTMITVTGPDSTLPARFFGSKATLDTYGDILALSGEQMSGLHLLTVTRSDLTTADLEGSFTPIEAKKIIDDAADSLYEIILTLAEKPSEQAFISKTNLDKILRENGYSYASYIKITASSTLFGHVSCAQMSALESAKDLNATILILEDTFQTPMEEAMAYSALDSMYLNPPPGTAKDWATAKIGHEAWGHVRSKIVPRSPQKNGDWIHNDTNCFHEGLCDVETGKFLRYAYNQNALQDTNVIRAFADYRAISAFMLSHNRFTLPGTEALNDHITTHIYNPDAPGFQNDFDTTNLYGYSTIPMEINNIVDAMAGYYSTKTLFGEMFEDDILSDINTTGQTDEQKLMVLSEYAQTGFAGRHEKLMGRYDYGVEKYHYAFLYFVNNGGLDAYKKTIPTQYHKVVDDFVNDYLAAIKRQGSDRFNNPALQAAMNQEFDAVVDLKYLVPLMRKLTAKYSPIPFTIHQTNELELNRE